MNEKNTLTSQFYVKIMCDHCADGIWDINGTGCELDDLPVPEDLKTMIKGWQLWYEFSETSDTFKQSLFDRKSHSSMGLLIANLVKMHLPDWTVVYFDESKSYESFENEKPRSYFEYEIK